MKLAIVIGSTREGRQTPKMAQWIFNTVKLGSDFQPELVDLADYPMPFFDEPISPRYNPDRKVKPEVAKWLDKIGSFDAYIFVTPEYNHSIPGVLKNALDYLTFELNRKPMTVATHGSVAGARAAMHLKEILSESRGILIPNSVAIAGASGLIDDDGNLNEEAKNNPYGPLAALNSALSELSWYSSVLAKARDL